MTLVHSNTVYRYVDADRELDLIGKVMLTSDQIKHGVEGKVQFHYKGPKNMMESRKVDFALLQEVDD